jgi:hypothetical protein
MKQPIVPLSLLEKPCNDPISSEISKLCRLPYTNEVNMEGRYGLIDAALVELPPESRLNSTIAVRILLLLIRAGIPVELIHLGQWEV